MKYGACLIDKTTTAFRLWAPDVAAVSLQITDGPIVAMQRDENGFFGVTAAVGAGTHYRYKIADDLAVPDPASRLQAGDVNGDSIVTDPAYAWQHPDWQGRPWVETIVYELHPGAGGGFAGIKAELPRLADLGITAIELMPIADFPGKHNWGYDGVLLYAPDTEYGTPEDLKSLIDTAHGLHIQVFLDVVYNHFGPDGNYLNAYAKSFFRADIHTPWGNAIDFRRPQVKEFFIENALYWLDEFRFDGLRFDAVHAIDEPDFLHALSRAIRAATPPGRHIHLILENENNDAAVLRATAHEPKFNAQWTDDWHHCVHVLLTGEDEGYYGDFSNPADQLARCLAEGFAYQGEPSAHAGGKPRGTSSAHLPPAAFVICLQNHDQIGNRAFGDRLTTLAQPQALRAATALLLFTPQIPMLFMGEDYFSTTPFLYFTDHHDELGKLITAGRRKEFAHFAAFSNQAMREKIPDPNAAATYTASIPTPEQNEWSDFTKTLLGLRHRYIIPRMDGCTATGAKAISQTAVRACWNMNDNSILTIATNFAATPVAFTPPPASVLFTTTPLTSDTLPAFTTSIWLAEP